MKRRTFIKRAGLFIPFAPMILHAQIMPSARHAAARPPAATSECTLLHEGIVSGGGAWAIGSESGKYYAGLINWEDESAHNICKVSAKLTKTAGDISGKTYYVTIWTMDSTALDEVVGTSGGVTGSNSWSSTVVDFTFSSAISLSADTPYGFTVSMSGSADASNYASGVNATPSSIPGVLSWNNGVTGVATSTFAAYDLQLNIYAQ